MKLISINAKLFQEGKRSLSIRNQRFVEETAFVAIASAGTVAIFFLNPFVGAAVAISTVLASAVDEYLQYQQHCDDDIVIDDIVTVFVQEGKVEMKGDRTLFLEHVIIESLITLKSEFSNIPYEVRYTAFG